MEQVFEHVYGLDVHKATIAACVRVPDARGKQVQADLWHHDRRSAGAARLARCPRSDPCRDGEHGRLLEAGLLRPRGAYHLPAGERDACEAASFGIVDTRRRSSRSPTVCSSRPITCSPATRPTKKLGADYYDRRHTERVARRAIQTLEQQGYRVTLERVA